MVIDPAIVASSPPVEFTNSESITTVSINVPRVSENVDDTKMMSSAIEKTAEEDEKEDNLIEVIRDDSSPDDMLVSKESPISTETDIDCLTKDSVPLPSTQSPAADAPASPPTTITIPTITTEPADITEAETEAETETET